MPLPKPIHDEYVDFFIDYNNKLFDDLPVDKSELEKRYQHLLKLKKTIRGNPDIYNALGVAECVRNNKEESIRYHHAAITIGSNNPNYYYNYSVSMLRLYIGTKDPLCLKDAKKQSKKALELAPMDIIVHRHLIRILETEGKINEAIEYIKVLLKDKFPGNEKLQELHEDLEDYDQFELAHKRAIDPNTKYIPLDEVISNIEIQG